MADLDLTPERWALVLRHEGLALALARRFSDCNAEELAEERGRPCLERCASHFDPSRGAEFATYAYTALLREYGRARRTLESLPDEDEIPSDEDETSDDELVQLIVRSLDEYDREILRLRFWFGMTYLEIGEAAGVGKATAFKDVSRAIERCRVAAKRTVGRGAAGRPRA